MNSLDALRKMVDHYPGGRPVMAARLGVTDEVLRKQLSGAATHKHGVIDALQISDMCIEAGSEHCYEFVNAVAGRCGGFVKLPVVDMARPTLQQCVSDAIREVSDVVTVALEGDADGVISDNDKDFVGPTEMLAELREDNLRLVEQFRVVKDASDEAKDNATSGIVDEWTDHAEERAWFLFEASRKG